MEVLSQSCRPSTAESSSRRWLNWGGKHPDATLEELKNMSGVKGSIMAVQRALNRFPGYKRNASRQRARPGGCKSLEKAVDPRGGQT
ncbi:MAG: hypothetical protein GKR87_01745 [Kiritimatiellae bacterium]|nr:hypothetical protein [Kiritimatiellia bacterium]